MNVFRRFLPYFKPYSWLIVLTLILSTTYSMLSAVSIYIILPVMELIFPDGQAEQTVPAATSAGSEGMFDGLKEQLREWLMNLVITPGNQRASLISLCLLIVVIFTLKNLFKYASNVTNTKIEQGVMKSIRDKLFARSVSLPVSFFNARRSGDLISTFTNEVSITNSALIPLFVKLTRDPLQALTLLLLLLALSVKLTLIAFSTSILTVVLIRVLKNYIRKYSTRMQEALKNITTRLQEAFQNVRIVKAYAGEEFESSRFRKETSWYIRSAMKHSIVSNLSGPISEIVAIAALAVVLFYGGLQVLDGTMQAEELITFLFLLFSIMTPIVGIFQIPTSIQRGVVAGEHVLELLEAQPEDASGTKKVDRLEQALTVEKVSFAYREDRPVLQDVSLEINKGETIALVGPSGGGKSTLMDLLIRFYDPTSGRIALDGTDIRDLSLQRYRSLFGIVTQESLLFNETVRTNIAYSADGVTEEKLIEAATIANAHGFISDLPEGYDTLIGDRGVLLSGGQRQRLAIARAVVRDPEILLFDEATSALDTESEVLVQKAIEEVLRNRTAVVIAHRLSTIRNANRIAVIEDGRIVEIGSHNELISREGLYKALYSAQFREEAYEEQLRKRNEQEA